MEKYKEEYYQSQGKNSFFKKSQKQDCAKELSQKFPLADMIKQTIYIVPNTNKIVFNYPVFKLFATESNYNEIIDYILSCYKIILENYPDYEVHCILDTFSVSAAERYKDAIKLFCTKSMVGSINYAIYLKTMYIYYTPSMIESITMLLKPFIDQSILKKIVFHTKKESPELLQKVLN